MILAELGKAEEAVIELRTAVANGLDDEAAHEAAAKLGWLLAELRRYEEATEVIENLQRTAPNDGKLALQRGAYLIEMERYEEAVAALTDGLRLQPDNSTMLCLRGGALAECKKHAEAMADIERSLAVGIDDPKVRAVAYHVRGNLHAALSDYYRAWTDLTKSIELNPRSADAYASKAAVYLAKGEFDRAIADCDAAIRLQPDCVDAFAKRGRAYFEKGLYDEAAKDDARVEALRTAKAAGAAAKGTSAGHVPDGMEIGAGAVGDVGPT